MCSVVLTLLAALAVGFLVGGGPVLWFALVVGLAVLGDDPGDRLTALAAMAATFATLSILRAYLAERLQR